MACNLQNDHQRAAPDKKTTPHRQEILYIYIPDVNTALLKKDFWSLES